MSVPSDNALIKVCVEFGGEIAFVKAKLLQSLYDFRTVQTIHAVGPNLSGGPIHQHNNIVVLPQGNTVAIPNINVYMAQVFYGDTDRLSTWAFGDGGKVP